MGSAQVIALSEVRASRQWQRLRDDLHTRFDQWLDRLQEQLPNPHTSLSEVTGAVWKLRQELTGGLSETIVALLQSSDKPTTQVIRKNRTQHQQYKRLSTYSR